MSTSALSSIALAQIIFKLRYANARYLQIAQQLRCRLHLTHHAKRRAYWVGLRVDITKAQNCPGTAISVKPLPIVDTTRSPATAEWPTLISLRSSAKGRHLSQASQLVHNQLGLQVPAAPRIVISSPGSCLNEIQSRPSAFVPSTITPNGHPRLIIRIPPLPRMAPLCDTDLPTAPIPGAPLLRSKELPVDSDFEMVDVPLKSAGSCKAPSPFPEVLTHPLLSVLELSRSPDPHG
ncbi:hypothetical protein BV22DRAFT_799970 [Leucogyrophana mollusca]|uniref:Uncharacterized protein n=1 Tax=Leucogyrophana mollusca TaxID=85980 RepID=A0ACB8B3X4_9AGAM|nr:hypothetical protein BV22DRAFT_799970 [Leucogyrophana mollusca]